MRAPLLIALSLLLHPGAELEVKAVGGRVSVKARGVPLSRILERLGQETGMKVVYEAAPPSQIVTAVVEADSEREVLTRVLEGLGVSYAFRLDPSGRRVEMLLVTRAAAAGPGPGPGGGISRPDVAPVMPVPIDNPEGFSESIPEDEIPEDSSPQSPFDDPRLLPQFPAVPEGPRDLPRPEFPKGVSYPSLP
jgi:hypothetical protein